MSESLPPTLNKTALLKLGWTPGLIAAILRKPDQVKAQKKGRYSWIEHLYSRHRVVAGMQDPRFLLLVDKRQARKEAAVRRQSALTESYASWREALPQACAGMFSLNRYAKHRSCSSLHRIEIYQLKNDLVELLYREGYSTACFIHRLMFETQLCHGCGGAGDLDCDRCGGDGIWKRARVVEFWCFEFNVDGSKYCWHQPLELVRFSPLATVPPQDMEGAAVREKPLRLRLQQFAGTKRLIRWVLEQWGSGVSKGVEEVAQRGAGGPFDVVAGDAGRTPARVWIHRIVGRWWRVFDGLFSCFSPGV